VVVKLSFAQERDLRNRGIVPSKNIVRFTSKIPLTKYSSTVYFGMGVINGKVS